MALPLRGWGAAITDAPSFVLERWDGKGSVALRDFAGKILVLDFFAYWCVPCQRASAEVEDKIRTYYASRGGNPQGVPVEVVAVNVEMEQRSRTEAFIRKNKLGLVVQDVDGATLRQYGGASLPHLVIIDGTQAAADLPKFQVVYRTAGFEGAAKLKAIIDRLGSARPRSSVEGRDPALEWVKGRLQRLSEAGRLPQWASVGETVPNSRVLPDEASERDGENPPQRLSLAFDGAFATDVQLTQGSASYRVGPGLWEASLNAGFGTIGLDYAPVGFDFLGQNARVDELRAFTQAAGRWRLFEVLTLVAGGGIYDGFTDYRSAWLSEYYRQQFSTLPGYIAPTPAGHNLSGGLRWEYLPATGFAQLDFSYLNDEIAPGYEIDFDGLRHGRPFLYTTVWRLAFENVLHRRLRVMHEFRRIDTSDRELRLGYQGSVNLALGERWIVKAQGGATTEQPEFDAWYVGGTVEYEIAPRWQLSAGGRYYADSGEIENSNFSNAAPPLHAWQAGVGMRYVTERWSFKLYAAPYATRYDPFGIGTAFFANLYRGRNWALVQTAVEYNF